MDHTPCNVSSPYQYPYANGAIGQYGFYVNAQAVMDKNRPDIMSYCEPEWVSDFTYQRWYDNQKSMLARVAQPVQDSVFVRVNLANDGTAKLQPVYDFVASPSDLPAKSDYSIQFLDDQGKAGQRVSGKCDAGGRTWAYHPDDSRPVASSKPTL